MGTSLKYNLSEYAKANSDIKNLKSDIQKSKKKMEDGLNQIKKDWTTDGGKAFLIQLIRTGKLLFKIVLIF